MKLSNYYICFGVILTALLPVRASADDPTATTYSVKSGAAPWSDRTGVWQLATVPPSVDGNGPFPQGNCSARDLTVPAGSQSILVGVSENDTAKFQADYTDAKPTGETVTISHADGTGTLNYTVFKMVSPPTTIQAKDPSQAYGAGLILLQIGEKTPVAAAPAPKPAAAK